MNNLFRAIIDDDLTRVLELVSYDVSLTSRAVTEDRLYAHKIFHWIYVGDTSLHLAAAGYRVEIAKALLAAGADPNAAGNRRRCRPLHYASDGYLGGPEWNPKRQVETIQLLLDATLT